MSYPEILPYVHFTNLPKNCSSPSNMVCKSIVEFPSDFAGAILHGVSIKRDLYSKKLLFSTIEINLFQGHLTFCQSCKRKFNCYIYFLLLQYGAKSAARMVFLLVASTFFSFLHFYLLHLGCKSTAVVRFFEEPQ